VATRQTTVDFILDQLQRLKGVRAKKMFGEYALYFEEKVVALICDDQLFVKTTPPGKQFIGSGCEEGFAYPGAKPSLLIGADELEDSERLCELVRITTGALPPAKPKANVKSSTTRTRVTSKKTGSAKSFKGR
jgi:TfoX/Sxy family transcriptional regulator of competence genes